MNPLIEEKEQMLRAKYGDWVSAWWNQIVFFCAHFNYTFDEALEMPAAQFDEAINEVIKNPAMVDGMYGKR